MDEGFGPGIGSASDDGLGCELPLILFGAGLFIGILNTKVVGYQLLIALALTVVGSVLMRSIIGVIIAYVCIPLSLLGYAAFFGPMTCK